MEIKNKAFRKAMDANGLSDLTLIRGYGYFYWVSDSNFELGVALMDVPKVMVCRFNQMALYEWITEAFTAYHEAQRIMAEEE